jgi:hypothetical protein
LCWQARDNLPRLFSGKTWLCEKAGSSSQTFSEQERVVRLKTRLGPTATATTTTAAKARCCSAYRCMLAAAMVAWLPAPMPSIVSTTDIDAVLALVVAAVSSRYYCRVFEHRFVAVQAILATCTSANMRCARAADTNSNVSITVTCYASPLYKAHNRTAQRSVHTRTCAYPRGGRAHGRRWWRNWRRVACAYTRLGLCRRPRVVQFYTPCIAKCTSSRSGWCYLTSTAADNARRDSGRARAIRALHSAHRARQRPTYKAQLPCSTCRRRRATAATKADY